MHIEGAEQVGLSPQKLCESKCHPHDQEQSGTCREGTTTLISAHTPYLCMLGHQLVMYIGLPVVRVPSIISTSFQGTGSDIVALLVYFQKNQKSWQQYDGITQKLCHHIRDIRGQFSVILCKVLW